MGQKGIVHPAVAVWAPDVAFLLLGAYLFRKTDMEQTIPLIGLLRDLVAQCPCSDRRKGERGMTIISRYILSVYLRLIALCAGSFVSIYLIIDFLKRIGRFTRAQAEPYHIFLFFLYKIPEITNQITPARRTDGDTADPWHLGAAQRGNRHAQLRHEHGADYRTDSLCRLLHQLCSPSSSQNS